MRSRHLIDPELAPILDMLPEQEITMDMIPAFRQLFAEGASAAPLPDLPVSIETIMIPNGKEPEVGALFIRPDSLESPAPALLQIHGGGFMFGTPYMNLPELVQKAHDLGCLIVAVDYRHAPETKHPGPLEDCYTALSWMHKNADQLGLDQKRIAVIGESAGGGLAAALCLLARDRGEHEVAFQLLEAPMLDDRTCLTPDPHPFTGEFVWSESNNHLGWSCLLGTEPGGADVQPVAAAARAKDLSGLPATFIAVGALDLFLEENIEYARRLTRAGVPTELHVYAGCIHGYGLAREASLTKRIAADSDAALKRAFS